MGVGASRASFIAVFGRPLEVTVRPMLRDHSPVCPVCAICNVGVLWPNGCMDQNATWYGGGPRPRRHCVTWGPSSRPTKRDTAPCFSLGHVDRGQMVAYLSKSPTSATAELFLWSPCVIGQAITFLPCGLFFFFFLLLFSSPNLSCRRLDVYHTSTHGVALVRI